MPRGQTAKDGDENVAANGYRYRRVRGVWRPVHHLIAEEKLGRAIDPKRERVIFLDRDRTNLNPDNIMVAKKRYGKSIRAKRLEDQIRVRFEELFELDEVAAARLHKELW
jgi:hypothetical protein